MKKIMSMCLIALLFLCACQGTSPASSTNAGVSEQPTETPAASLSQDLGVMPQDIKDALEEDVEFMDGYSAEVDGLLATRFIQANHKTPMSIMCFQKDASSPVCALMLILPGDSNEGNSKLFGSAFVTAAYACGATQEDLQGLFDSAEDLPKLYTSDSVELQFFLPDSDNVIVYSVKAANADLHISSLPFTINKGEDFFNDEERAATYKENYEKYDFVSIKAQIDEYIAENEPDQSDSAYAIRNILETLDQDSIAKNVSINHDSVESNTIIKYKGVEDVSSSVNFVTYLSKGRVSYRLGFKQSGWIFFEDIIISTDETNITKHFGALETEREVIGGGTIMEYGEISLSAEQIEYILNSSAVTIRFKNGENDKARDHEMTAAEKDALKTITSMRTAHTDLSNLLFQWNK